MTESRAHVCSVPFFANEYWFGRCLMRYGIEISTGVTTPEERQARARRGILEKDLAAQRVVLRQADIFAQVFERLYGEPLTTETPSGEALSPQQLEVPL